MAMTDQERFSRTMRIDLIPDAPTDPVPGKKRHVIVAPSSRRHSPASSTQTSRSSDNAYRELLQSIYDGVLIADINGRVVDCNPRACDFFGYDLDRLSGLSIPNLISGADQSLIGSLWQNLQEERFTLIQAYCLRSNGSFFPAEIAVNRLHLREVRLCFLVRDITVRRQAEEMLRTEHNAIQNAGDGIAVANLDAVIEYANPAMARLWEFESSEDLFGLDVRDFFLSRTIVDDMIQGILKEQKTWVADFQAVRGAGEKFDVKVTATRNRNSDGEVVGMVMSFSDIGDRKRAEEAVRQTEQQRVMLESLGAATHHLCQPATVLQGNLDLLYSRLKVADPEIQTLLESSLKSMDELRVTLHRLNQVTQYRTMPYLNGSASKGDGCNILKI